MLGVMTMLILAFAINSVVSHSFELPDLPLMMTVMIAAYVWVTPPAALAGFVWGFVVLKFLSQRALPLYVRALGGILVGGIFGLADGAVVDIVHNVLNVDAERSKVVLFFTPLGAIVGGILAMFFPSSRHLGSRSNNAMHRSRVAERFDNRQ
jgi:hypothetical protein